MKKIFKRNIKTDTLPIWTSFLEVCLTWCIASVTLTYLIVQYMLYRKDPRRVQPLVDYLVNEFDSLDFNGESTFDISQILCFFRAFYEEMSWKFNAWADDMVCRIWKEIWCEHDDVGNYFLSNVLDPNVFALQVRSYIGEMLAFADKIKVGGISQFCRT